MQCNARVAELPEDSHALERELAVGTMAFLDINPRSGTPTRCRTAIRGWNPGHSVYVDKPSAKSGIMLRHNQPCALRFIRDGVVWGFLSNIRDPAPERADRVLRLGWPLECSHLHLRRFERVRVSIPCSIDFTDGSSVQASIRDISCGGCGLVTDVPLAHGSQFSLTFTLPDGLLVESIGAEVRNVRPISSSECLYGCQFSNLQEYERSGIGLFVVKALTLERGHEKTSARVLLLSNDQRDADTMRVAASGTDYEIVLAQSVVDLFFQMRAFPPRALLIHARQTLLPADEVCRVVKQTPGFDRLPVIVYGNEAALIREAVCATGATLYMEELSDSPVIRSLLNHSIDRSDAEEQAHAEPETMAKGEAQTA